MSNPDENPSPQTGRAAIPPFEEADAAPKAPLKALAQLFAIPALIVLVAIGIFLVMNLLVGDRQTPQEILQRVSSGDSRRRGQAAFELSKRIVGRPEILEDEAFRARLVDAYRASRGGDPQLRRYLTRIISFTSMPQAIPLLLEATHDDDPETRLYAVAALGTAGGTDAVPRLEELLQDGDPGLRIVSLASLAAIGDPSALPAIEARLADASVDVAWNAANALAHLGSAAGEELLRLMLDADYLASQPGITEQQRQQAMQMAVEGLGALQRRAPTAERRGVLERMVREAPFPRVQEAARQALAPGGRS